MFNDKYGLTCCIRWSTTQGVLLHILQKFRGQNVADILSFAEDLLGIVEVCMYDEDERD